MLALLLGCDPAPDSGAEQSAEAVECHSLRTEDALPSATQTFAVTYDAVGRRVLATDLGLPYLSVIAPDGGARTAAIHWATSPANNPWVGVDGTGVAWIGAMSEPWLVRVDLTTGGVQPIDEASGVSWLLALDDSVLVPQNGEVVRIGADGTVLATTGIASGAARVGDDVVLVSNDFVIRRDADTLAPLDSCAVPFPAKFVAALPDDSFVVGNGQRVSRFSCDDPTGGTSWDIGNDIASLIADGTSVWALDRIGTEDPTRGVAWKVDTAGDPIPAFPTAKNTGYGAVVDGTLWANAEGSSEVMAWSLADGERVAEASTGTSAADLVVDDDGGVIVTGRLSALTGRLDGHTVTRAEPVEWPWAPVLAGDRLVMLDHLNGQLASVDAHTLDDLELVDLGTGDNSFLTFDSLVYAPDRGTWLVAESEADVLLEVDEAAGVVINQWPLGGPALTDAHLAAQLELQLLGDVALLARTSDGRLTRLNLTTGERLDGALFADQLTLLRSHRQSRATQLRADAWWIGPLRVDVDSLAVVEKWHDVGALLAPWPDTAGEWLAISPPGTSLLHVDNGGEVLASFAWFDASQPGTVAALTPEGDAAWVTRSYEGRVCRVPLATLDAGSTKPLPYP